MKTTNQLVDVLRGGALAAMIVLLLGLNVGCGDTESEQCLAGQQTCSGVCTDLETDSGHCGECGNACGSNERCVDGGCEVVCPPEHELCGGACVDTDVSRQHCGGCGQSCEVGEVCSAGSCDVVCDDDFTRCGGSCRNLDQDRRHCGDCDSPCGLGKRCEGGECVLTCPAGLEDCFGSCVDTESNPEHCGGCGIDCDSGQVCSEGECTDTCGSGLTSCNSACVDVDHDAEHCGECNNSCGTAYDASVACVDTECAFQCIPGWGNCNGDVSDGCETDLQYDEVHCGGCNQACPGDMECEEGSCRLASPAGVDAVSGDEAVVLTWEEHQSAGAFVVYRCDTSNFCDEDPVAEVPQPGWVDDSDLTLGQAYYYWVGALSGEQASALSGPVSMTPGALQAPTDLSCEATDGEVVLNWDVGADAAAASHFEIFGSDTDPGTEVPSTNLGVREADDPTKVSYAPGTDGPVYYAVRPVIQGPGYYWEGEVSETVGCAASAPTDVYLTESGTERQIHWKASSVPGLTTGSSYEVYWRDADDPGAVIDGGPVDCSPGSACSAVAEGLDTGLDYAFWVVATNEVGASSDPASDEPMVRDIPGGLVGEYDDSFASEGTAQVAVELEETTGAAVAEHPSGDIVTAGSFAGRLYAMRYDAEGDLNSSFGTSGVARPEFDVDSIDVRAAEWDGDHGFVIAYATRETEPGEPDIEGVLVAKFDGAGELVESFGDGGAVTMFLDADNEDRDAVPGTAMVLEDGAILVGGRMGQPIDDSGAFFVRLDPEDGSPDSGFGEDGVAVISADEDLGGYSWQSQILALAERPDGRLLAGGTMTSDLQALVFQLHPDGELDTAFADQGVFLRGFGDERGDRVRTLRIDAGGRLLMGGEYRVDDRTSPLVGRLLEDGTLDPSFGDEGFAALLAPHGPDAIRNIVFLDDGRYLVGGEMTVGSSWSSEDPVLGPLAIALTPDGAPDLNFGNNGRALKRFADERDFTVSDVLWSGDRYYFYGTFDDDPDEAMLVRFE